MVTKTYNSIFTSYLTGFILSLALTLLAYLSVVSHVLNGGTLVAALFGFAMIQLFVQLVFFLHMGKETKPYWNVVFFISTVCIILIMVIGSLWIMNHLNYNMTPADMNNALIKGEGIQK